MKCERKHAMKYSVPPIILDNAIIMQKPVFACSASQVSMSKTIFIPVHMMMTVMDMNFPLFLFVVREFKITHCLCLVCDIVTEY